MAFVDYALECRKSFKFMNKPLCPSDVFPVDKHLMDSGNFVFQQDATLPLLSFSNSAGK